MNVVGVTPILNVSDVVASLAWFESLGWARGFAWGAGGFDGGEPSFASVRSGNAEIFLSRDGQGSRGSHPPRHAFDTEADGVWTSWFLESRGGPEALHARAVGLGYEVSMPPADQPWGIREFHLRHPDGRTFRVGC